MRTDQPSTPIGKANPHWKVGIIRSSFYKEEIDALTKSAQDALVSAGIPAENISVYDVPGSFEIPLIGAALAEKEECDALIALGIIVEGETHHADLLARESARGIMDVQLGFGIPFAFEILYVDQLADAQKRLNKGEEAARAVIESLTVLEELKR